MTLCITESYYHNLRVRCFFTQIYFLFSFAKKIAIFASDLMRLSFNSKIRNFCEILFRLNNDFSIYAQLRHCYKVGFFSFFVFVVFSQNVLNVFFVFVVSSQYVLNIFLVFVFIFVVFSQYVIDIFQTGDSQNYENQNVENQKELRK